MPSRRVEVGKDALPDPWPALPPHLRARTASPLNFESFWEEEDKTLCPAQTLSLRSFHPSKLF